MTTQDAAPVADQPDSLAVALALEMAAKVCEDVDNEYEEGRAYVAAERIRALIPADLAAEAQRQVEDAEKWRKYMRQVEKVKTAMRPQPDDAAIDAARAAKWMKGKL